MRGFFNPIRTALLVLTVLTVALLAVVWPPEAAAQLCVQCWCIQSQIACAAGALDEY